MKVIYNKLIPFPGFKCVNIFGVVFAREGATIDRYTLNHEAIHTAQMKELGYIFFYIVYLFEWLTNLIVSPSTAYRSISFEEEAYAHETDFDYLDTRRHWAQWRK